MCYIMLFYVAAQLLQTRFCCFLSYPLYLFRYYFVLFSVVFCYIYYVFFSLYICYFLLSGVPSCSFSTLRVINSLARCILSETWRRSTFPSLHRIMYAVQRLLHCLTCDSPAAQSGIQRDPGPDGDGQRSGTPRATGHLHGRQVAV